MSGSQILLVDLVSSRRRSIRAVLESAGYDVTIAEGFLEAREHLDRCPPDVLVTQLRLGTHNGLHLVLRGRLRHPGMRAIVTERDRTVFLDREASRMDVTYLVWPLSPGELIDTVRTEQHRLVDDAVMTTAPDVSSAGTQVVQHPHDYRPG